VVTLRGLVGGGRKFAMAPRVRAPRLGITGSRSPLPYALRATKEKRYPPVLVGIRAGCAVRPPALLVSRSGCCTRVCSWLWHRWHHQFQCVHDRFGIRTGTSLKVQASWAQLRLTVCRVVVVAGAVCAGRFSTRGNRRTDSNADRTNKVRTVCIIVTYRCPFSPKLRVFVYLPFPDLLPYF